MILIHLAKIALLEKSCNYFKKIIIANKVYSEIMKGKEKGYGEVILITDLINKRKINVGNVKDKRLVEKANKFNIRGGEAESVALYWQEQAKYLATDDDNVRKKSTFLNFRVIGTPAIILQLHKNKIIEKDKFIESIKELKKIGWFSNSIIDKLFMEAE